VGWGANEANECAAVSMSWKEGGGRGWRCCCFCLERQRGDWGTGRGCRGECTRGSGRSELGGSTAREFGEDRREDRKGCGGGGSGGRRGRVSGFIDLGIDLNH
jgi:hypothetical protein